MIPFVGGVKTVSAACRVEQDLGGKAFSKNGALIRFDAGFMWEKIPQINTYYSAQAFESFGVGGWGCGCQNSSDGITHIYFFHNFDTKIGVSSFRRGVSKAQWAVSGLVAPLSGASSGVSSGTGSGWSRCTRSGPSSGAEKLSTWTCSQ